MLKADNQEMHMDFEEACEDTKNMTNAFYKAQEDKFKIKYYPRNPRESLSNFSHDDMYIIKIFTLSFYHLFNYEGKLYQCKKCKKPAYQRHFLFECRETFKERGELTKNLNLIAMHRKVNYDI